MGGCYSKENKYNFSSIYKIVSKNTTNVYIGSTTKELNVRLSRHKNDYNRWCRDNSLKYNRSGDVIKYGDYEIILLKSVNVNTKRELLEIEAIFIKSFQNVNKNIPLRTKREYYEDNKELTIERSKKYYENNKEQVLERSKIYYANNKKDINKKNKLYRETHEKEIKENRAKYRKNHLEETKNKNIKYYQENKEKLKENARIYREKNKDKKKETINCPCGSIIFKKNKSGHLKSTKHIDYLKRLENE